MLDLLIYVPDVLSFVDGFTFYSIFFTYGTAVTLETTRGSVLVAMIVLSGIFFALEIKGAVYMRDTINEIMESDQKGT